MANYNSNRTGQAHDNDENRLTTLENINTENRLTTLENRLLNGHLKIGTYTGLVLGEVQGQSLSSGNNYHTITFPTGDHNNAAILYSTHNNNDLGAFYISPDTAFVINSGDSGYVFKILDKDPGDTATDTNTTNTGFIAGFKQNNSGFDLRCPIQLHYQNRIVFYGKNDTDAVCAQMGYMPSVTGVMHSVSSAAGYQASGAFYIWSNGCDAGNDNGGLAIDNEGVTVFGAGDPATNFQGVFRVVNEDSVGSGAVFRVLKTGAAYAASWNSNSKREYKTNILEYQGNAINLINTIKICSFNYKDDLNTNKIGFIADDTHEIFAGKDHDIMDINNCVGMLLKAVQELSAENEELKQRISKLEQVIDNGGLV